MLRLFTRKSKTENHLVAGAHIEVWVQAESVWVYGLYQRPVPVEGRHLVHVYVDGDWYPVAVCTEDLDLSTWGWA
jgi:hypothetical protein